jgi:hypothetical protein
VVEKRECWWESCFRREKCEAFWMLGRRLKIVVVSGEGMVEWRVRGVSPLKK